MLLYSMSCSLYIISTSECEKSGRFKIGIHTGEITGLISRYRTALPDLTIKLFVLLAEGKAKEIESKIKLQFASNSVPNMNGNNSEWFHVQLKILYGFIFPLLIDAAPDLEENEKHAKEITELDNMMSKIGQHLRNAEKLASTFTEYNDSRETDIMKGIKSEQKNYLDGTFKGEKLLYIRKLVMEYYTRCMRLRDPFNGECIIKELYQISVIMNDINDKFPNRFKKIPRIVILDQNGRTKEDLMCKRAGVFVDRVMNRFIQQHWEEILDLNPMDWILCLNLEYKIAPEDHRLSLKRLIKKSLKK